MTEKEMRSISKCSVTSYSNTSSCHVRLIRPVLLLFLFPSGCALWGAGAGQEWLQTESCAPQPETWQHRGHVDSWIAPTKRCLCKRFSVG